MKARYVLVVSLLLALLGSTTASCAHQRPARSASGKSFKPISRAHAKPIKHRSRRLVGVGEVPPCGPMYVVMTMPAYTRTTRLDNTLVQRKNTCAVEVAIEELGLSIARAPFHEDDISFPFSTGGVASDGVCATGSCTEDITGAHSGSGLPCAATNECVTAENETCNPEVSGECTVDGDCNGVIEGHQDPEATCVGGTCHIRVCRSLLEQYACGGLTNLIGQAGGGVEGVPTNSWNGAKMKLVRPRITVNNPTGSVTNAEANDQVDVDAADIRSRANFATEIPIGPHCKSWGSSPEAQCYVRGPTNAYVGDADTVFGDTLVCTRLVQFF